MRRRTGQHEVLDWTRRRIQNHLGTVHAIALCNAAELAGGLATDVTIPGSMRWIPKGMTVRYLKKALGVLTATAQVDPVADSATAQELHALVVVRDASNDIVFDADITMWISPRKSAQGNSDFARHPGIAKRYPGSSASAFQRVVKKALGSRLRGNDEDWD